MTTVAATVQLMVASNTSGAPTLGACQSALNQQLGVALTAGTGAGQADTSWFMTRTLASSASETLNFGNGSLVDLLNNAISLARIKILIVSASASNTNSVIVGGTGTTITTIMGGTSPTTILRPGACVAWLSGTTDATAMVLGSGVSSLAVSNSSSGSSVSYEIIVIGSSQ